MHAHGLTEDSNFDKERSSERTFATIERLGQDICTSAPYVCQDIELCQRLDLQDLGGKFTHSVSERKLSLKLTVIRVMRQIFNSAWKLCKTGLQMCSKQHEHTMTLRVFATGLFSFLVEDRSHTAQIAPSQGTSN